VDLPDIRPNIAALYACEVTQLAESIRHPTTATKLPMPSGG
jgi:hypothetical protein